MQMNWLLLYETIINFLSHVAVDAEYGLAGQVFLTLYLSYVH